jgi:hypothetical protein
MQQLPSNIWAAFQHRLEQLPQPQPLDYDRSARFYQQFCEKYGHSPVLPTSLGPFVNRLTAKNLPMEPRRQASAAVRLLRHAAVAPRNNTELPAAISAPALTATPTPSPITPRD